ncbi:hypothetical protein JCM3770_003462 [Rhodotorula araucariae]
MFARCDLAAVMGRTAAGTRVDGPSRVVLDEYGVERRSLPPLGLDGRPTAQTLAQVEQEAKPLKRAVKRRASKTPATPADGGGADVAPEASEEAAPSKAAVTALEKAVRADLAAYPDALLLTQVGSFFESYFEQAKTVAKLLGIKLTSKQFGKGSNKVPQPFCGFPLFQLGKHVSALVEAGHKVVIVEEFKEAGVETAVTVRRVTRVVTPGTGVDESFVQLEQSNFVLALGVADGTSVRDEIGMAYRDVSTGASFTRQSKLSSLRDDIHLVQPKEVVVDSRLKDTKLGERILDLLRGENLREGIMVSETSTDAVPSSSTSIASPNSAAEAVLLAYLANTLVTTPPPRSSAKFVDPAKVMQMDATTLKSLEIRESLRGGVRGSLLSAVRRTVTPGGHRLLIERLCAPSTDLPTIHTRLALVSAFLDGAPTTRSYLRALLRTLDDTPRLLQRLALRRSHPAHDLLGLKRTMRALATVRTELAGAKAALDLGAEKLGAVEGLAAEMGTFDALADEIDAAIDEDALTKREEQAEREAVLAAELGERAASRATADDDAAEEGLWGEAQAWVIRPDFSRKLAKLHTQLKDLREEAATLQESLRTRYKSKNLTLKTAMRVGPAVHILLKDGVKEIEKDPHAMVHQRTNSTRLYVIRDWAVLHRKIVETEEKIRNLEIEATQVLVARVLENYDSLLHTADALAELDVVMGFAELAEENGWVQPEVDTSSSLEIVNGRHATVENALTAQNRSFTPNSVTFRHVDDYAEDASFIHVLTGPNMAGKSTFLRQTALIAVLAQAGSYVPAASARIGIFDRVFSRVGARDELDRDRSTFMIEMDEATSILENATSRSLVLLDELGRGTSPIDGLAIAYAALEHLARVNRARTLFATHYHRLGALLGYDEADPRGKGEWEGIEFWCTDVEETEDSVRYVHTIRRGLNSDSAGLVIARLAGMPPRAILTAREMRDRQLISAKLLAPSLLASAPPPLGLVSSANALESSSPDKRPEPARVLASAALDCMQSFHAGPSSPPPLSTPSAASPPPRHPSSSAVPNPYDSPLKPQASATATYAAGGQETDVADDDDGGDLGVRIAVRSSPEKGKGKARALEPDYAYVRSASGDVVIEMGAGSAEDDEAAEERRIQENLARWSQADAKRRASLRRSTKLVMPPLPSSTPVSLPSPTALVRRTSVLLRSGSRRRRKSVEIGGLVAEELELGTDAMQLEEGVSGRRGRRKLSVQIGIGTDAPDGVGGPRSVRGEGGLPRVGEEANDEPDDGAHTPTSASHSRASQDTAPLATPTSPPLSNPFSPSNASFVSLESTATDRTARTGSRFIEDLPALPPSTSVTPRTSPSKPASNATPTNPFLDVVITSPTPTRPGARSRTSEGTLHTLTSYSFSDADAPPRTPSPAGSGASSPFSSPGLGARSATASPYQHSPSSGARQRRPPRATAAMDPLVGAASYGIGAGPGGAGEDEIGWLDWLLCGCFRAGGGQRDERVEQQGRTNPME